MGMQTSSSGITKVSGRDLNHLGTRVTVTKFTLECGGGDGWLQGLVEGQAEDQGWVSVICQLPRMCQDGSCVAVAPESKNVIQTLKSFNPTSPNTNGETEAREPGVPHPILSPLGQQWWQYEFF